MVLPGNYGNFFPIHDLRSHDLQPTAFGLTVALHGLHVAASQGFSAFGALLSRWRVRLNMLRIVGVVLILWGIGWLASEMPATPNSQLPTVSSSSWRRTCDGWERADWRLGIASHQEPVLHPAVVGLTQLFFVLAALIGFTPEAKPGDPIRSTDVAAASEA